MTLREASGSSEAIGSSANTRTVIELIGEAVARGAALMGIFHDPEVGAAVATRRIDVAQFRSAS